MNTMLKPKTTYKIDRQAEFSAKLTAAHARIEKTFLDGGAVLVSVMEILSNLIGILDGMTGTLDGKTAKTPLRVCVKQSMIWRDCQKPKRTGRRALSLWQRCARQHAVTSTISMKRSAI
jgi:hypothetical protein